MSNLCRDGNHKDKIIENTKSKITYKCESCGRVYAEIIDQTEHVWSDWIIDRDPTCLEEGVKHRFCNVGSRHEEQEKIPATGHQYEEKYEAKSCTEKGKIIFTCTLCDDSYEEENEEPIGHDYLREIDVEATCQAKGKIIHRCIRCDDSYEEEVNALPHQLGEWSEEKLAENGETIEYRECLYYCGYKEEQTIESAAPVFNTADAVIAITNVNLIIFFIIFILVDVKAIMWDKKKREELKERRKKERLEVKSFDFR